MISARAQGAFARMMRDALRGGLGVADESAWTVQELPPEEAASGGKVVILTVSSYLFRLMTLLHFDEDAATWQHFGGADAGAEIDRQVLHDRVSECGNVICGALNREVARVYPHVGMSTPNIIDRHCVDFLGALGAGQARHWRVQLADGLVLHARLWVCAYDAIDFDAPVVAEAAVEEAAAGELEMF